MLTIALIHSGPLSLLKVAGTLPVVDGSGLRGVQLYPRVRLSRQGRTVKLPVPFPRNRLNTGLAFTIWVSNEA